MSSSLNNFFNAAGTRLGNLIGNPNAKTPVKTGFQRAPFTQPTAPLSSVIKSSTGIFRTNNGNPIQLDEKNKIRQRLQQPGFTPLNYYRTSTGEYFIKTPTNLRTTSEALGENIDSYDQFDDSKQSNFKFSLGDYVKFISAKNNLETADGSSNANFWQQVIDKNPERLRSYPGTPYDNEDPVYFGFEIIINVDSSPLLNGELEKFFDQIGLSYTEVESKREILNQFKNELYRYFKFDRDLNAGEIDKNNLIISTDSKKRRYYVRKISGMDKLIESNTSSSKNSFVDYGKDILTFTFFEDTTINLGTLSSLYKLLYWSRLRGKNLIPENLLRFDCEVIVSELRNFVTLKKSGNMLQELKANLSRYKYKIYECQFFVNKMSHPESIDLGSTIEKTDSYDIQVSYKFSTMIFERYDPVSDIKKTLYNGYENPLDPLRVGSNTQMSGTGSNINVKYSKVNGKVINTYNNISQLPNNANSNNFSGSTTNPSQISTLKSNQNINIYNLNNSKNPSSSNTVKPKDIYGDAAKKLLDGIKSSALREVQGKMNQQFALLNNSLDKIRNSTGLGKMSAPTNIYSKPIGGPFFFDVQNSLRGFAGDVLTGLISR